MKSLFRFLIPILVIGTMTNGYAGDSKWRQLERGNIIVFCHEEDVRHGSRVMAFAEEALPRISRDVGLSKLKKMKIIIASSEREFASLTGGQLPEWGIGAADSYRSTIFLKSPRFARPETDLRQIVIHEVSHVVLGMVLGGREVDRWFDEGFAQYEAGEISLGSSVRLARSLFVGDFLSLEEINDVLNFHRQKAALAYEESRAAVEYLVEQYGKKILIQITRALREGKGMDEALQSTIGSGFHDFQSDWCRAMKQKYRWYVLLDFPLIISMALVVLFFTAFFVTRKRIQRKRKVWENEGVYGFESCEKDSASS